MKKILLLIGILSFTSCKCYYDNNNAQERIVNDSFKMELFTNSNKLFFLSNRAVKSDSYIQYPQHYEINLPKKIKDWEISGNRFYLDYGNKQFIIIDAGYSDNKRERVFWSLANIDNLEKEKFLINFWNEKKYDEDYIFKEHKGRITKQYTDQNVKILLYNIKEENFNDYFNLIKSFKYLN